MSKQTSKKLIKDVVNKIINVLQQYPHGATTKDFQKELKDVETSLLVEGLNRLLNQKRIQVFKDDDILVYKEIPEDMVEKLRDLKQDEMLVYQIIEQSSNMGIWQKDLKLKSKLQTRQITKIIKNLTSRKLIKTVKTIHGKNKKVFMLANIEPSPEITGGAWYQGDELNIGLISKLQEAAWEFISTKKACTTEDVLDYIRSKGISGQIDLRKDDMQNIIDTLVFDGLVEEVADIKTKVYYKPSGIQTQPNIFTEIPCSTCPVFDKCTDDGEINPVSCPYFTKWLEFDF